MKIEIEQVKKQLQLMLSLQRFGYQVELTPLKHYVSSENPDRERRKGDSDIRIAIKVFDELPTMEKLILVSGDGDFLPLLKKVRKEGKDVTVMGYKTRDSTNRTAKEIANFAGGAFLNIASSDMKMHLEYRRKG